ncbi:flagellar biosynthesis protein FlgA [Mycolicibacterium sp. P1-18]|uniref:SAF domain-containing protein n=1 Tax=Mycolicibacterium sp. P1-18 TaxID=2024615 RepID=UPI0011F35AE9|nr:SAF domain-containing protein [Mycolicibacterium sp. P1-18]KAA0096878.1 flagellar biosynthesis protein FlgA [Mycolicibacterium sp. P1-18]
MGESLDPSLTARLAAGLRPDWTRTVMARRVAAGALVLLAAAAALRPDPSQGRSDVVVATRDLAPGVELVASDLRVESRATTTIPDGASTDGDDLVGATLAGPARRGEVLTDVRVMSSRLADAAAGPDARIVPVHPTDAALLDLVRTGDVVDVLAVSESTDGSGEQRSRVVATNAIVVLVSGASKDRGRDGVVLVALPVHEANEVAGASLSQAITLTFH